MNKKNEEMMLGVKLRIVHNKIDKYFDRRNGENDLCLPKGQGMTLHYLIEHSSEDIFQRDIERHFGITGATATNILKGLEKNNLILRVSVEKDARLKKIVLTENAYETETQIRKKIDILEDGMIKGFSEEELSNLLRMIERVTLNIDNLIQDNE